MNLKELYQDYVRIHRFYSERPPLTYKEWLWGLDGTTIIDKIRRKK